MSASFWMRLRRLRHELGTFNACLYVADQLIRRADRHSGLHHYRFFAQPVAQTPRLPAHRGNSFSFRLIEAPDVILEDLGRPSTVISERFAQGSQCLAATKNGGLVGCIWFVKESYAEDEVRADYLLPTQGNCVWDFDVFVKESERLGFLFAKQWDVFDALLAPQGIRYTLSRISAFNQRSISSHRSLGAHDCGGALFLILGKLQIMLALQSPFLALGGRPRLLVEPKDATIR